MLAGNYIKTNCIFLKNRLTIRGFFYKKLTNPFSYEKEKVKIKTKMEMKLKNENKGCQHQKVNV